MVGEYDLGIGGHYARLARFDENDRNKCHLRQA